MFQKARINKMKNIKDYSLEKRVEFLEADLDRQKRNVFDRIDHYVLTKLLDACIEHKIVDENLKKLINDFHIIALTTSEVDDPEKMMNEDFNILFSEYEKNDFTSLHKLKKQAIENQIEDYDKFSDL